MRDPGTGYPASIYACPCEKYAHTICLFDPGFAGRFLGFLPDNRIVCNHECERDYNLEKAQRSICPFIDGHPLCLLERCEMFNDDRKTCTKAAEWRCL